VDCEEVGQSHFPVAKSVFECTSALSLICGLAFFGERLGHRDARHHLLAHGGVIDEGGHDGRGLHHITWLHAIVYIHIGMMRPSVVLHRILQETEAGKSNEVE